MPKPGRIGADAEKRRLAEGQDSGISPQHVDGQCNGRIQERADHVVDEKRRQAHAADGQHHERKRADENRALP
jgi:hypothetical protein